jgi:hypothetical protein
LPDVTADRDREPSFGVFAAFSLITCRATQNRRICGGALAPTRRRRSRMRVAGNLRRRQLVGS